MNLLNFEEELSLTNTDDCNQTALDILQTLKPEWKRNEVTFEYFSVGITNKIFSASFGTESVIFRVFGKNTNKIIDRENEVIAWEKLANYKMAAPLYAKFSNGLVCGFMKGKTLVIEQMRQPEFYKKVARTLAHLHSTVPADDSNPILFVKMRQFNSVFVAKYEDGIKQNYFLTHFLHKLEDDIVKLESHILPKNEKVAFCHNDVLVHNIVYDQEEGATGFIDYEYASPNYLMFDIANHFCEYAGVDDTPDYKLCLTKEQKLEFIKEYLGENADTAEGQDRVDVMMKNMPLFEAAAHLFWTIWALVQSQNSVIEFDYLRYAAARYYQFNKRFKKFVDNQ